VKIDPLRKIEKRGKGKEERGGGKKGEEKKGEKGKAGKGVAECQNPKFASLVKNQIL